MCQHDSQTHWKILITMAPIKLVFDISDIHCGSNMGLLPPGIKTSEGDLLTQNPVQEWLWSAWQQGMQWMEEVANDDPYALVLNGDLIEGVHHKTVQIMSSDIGDHVRIAKTVLKPLVKRAEKTFIVKGTECHTHNSETAIGESLGAEVNPDTDMPSFDRLTLDVNGVRCVFRHHIGTTVRRGLSGTQLSLALAEEQVEAANAGDPIPRVLCCAHRHKVGYYQDDNGLSLVTGAWQALTRHGHKIVSPARCTPSIAALDFRGLPTGTMPKVHSKIFAAQNATAIAI